MYYDFEESKDFLKSVLNPIAMPMEVYRDSCHLVEFLLFGSMTLCMSLLLWAILPITIVLGLLIGIKLEHCRSKK